MKNLNDLQTPALVIDLDKLEANIESMAERTRRLGVSLRPHIKTHKCIEIARLQQKAGARGLTVSTLFEARVFGDHGFDDLTWAFPLIHNRVPEVRELAERFTLRLLVDSLESVEILEAENFPFHVWLKVDCGYHRAGVDPEDELARDLVHRLASSSHLLFDGILTHSGHAYKACSPDELQQVAEQERQVMSTLAARCRDRGFDVPAVSVGSTPAMSAAQSLDGIDEARPGNYVFYDHMQVDLGSCQVSDCALSVLTSVVSVQPGAGHCVVDAGALALSKDPGAMTNGIETMGQVFEDYDLGLLSTEYHLKSLSQEHGILSHPLGVGERVRILPNHSCLTVACFDRCAVVRGARVVDQWRIWSGRN